MTFHLLGSDLATTAVVIGWLLGVVGVSSLIPRYGWLFDIASHFRAQIAGLNLAGAAVCCIIGRVWVALALTLIALAIIVTLVPFWRKGSEPHRHGIRLVLFNVRMRNRQFGRTVDFVLQESPDMLGLVEVDQRWLDGVQRLQEHFPYQAQVPHPASYGLALFSRFPIVAWSAARLDGLDTDHLEAVVELPVGAVNVIMAHLPPPLTPSEWRRRDRGLALLGKLASTKTSPTLVMGDFNASPWTPALKDMEKRATLRSFRRDRGIAASWPSRFWLGHIPIDHVLGTAGMIQFGRPQVGPDLGSDHLPVGLTIFFPKMTEG